MERGPNRALVVIAIGTTTTHVEVDSVITEARSSASAGVDAD